MTVRRRITAVLATAALLVPAAAWPSAASAAGDTSAVAVNTKDGSSVFRLAFSVRKVMGQVVDQQNAAVAYASCESCQTVAISIQVLLVASDPEVLTPTNLAIAINDQCTLCETLASAYQFVIGTGERLTLSGQGRQELQRIRQALKDLGKSGLPIEEIQARTDTLMDDLRQVLATQLLLEPADNGAGDGKSPPPADEGTGGDQDGSGTQTTPTTTTPDEQQTTPEPSATDGSPTATTPAQ